jgi:uncharacterized pyridoxamine 5'-phosphate oxidase family protein
MKKEIKKIIEENPFALATVNPDGTPHAIAVAFAKVKEGKIIITNDYMKTTPKNIKKNPNVSLAAWNKRWEGYQIAGKADYFEEGKWLKFIKSIPELKNEPRKGAIVITVNKIKVLA